jgi:hypothetical protein
MTVCRRILLALAVAAATGISPPPVAADPVTFSTPPPPVDPRRATVTASGSLVRAPGGPAPENADETITSAVVTAMVHLANRLTVGVQVPYLDRRVSVDVPGGDQATRQTSGVGDVTALAGLTIKRWRTGGPDVVAVSLIGSVKAPTGADDESDALGRLPQRFQVGTGAWDGMIGAAASYCAPPLEADLTVGYLHRTAAHDFDAGDELRGALSVRRCVAPWGCFPSAPRRLYGAVETRATWYARDRGRLAPAETGGPRWSVAPALQALLGRSDAIEAALEVPLVQPTDHHIAAIVHLGYRRMFE